MPKHAPKPAVNFTFMRSEVKYRIPHDRYEEFLKRIDPYFQLDSYGLTTICNIYYDTEKSDLISRSLDKPKYKEKIRLRSYGVPKKDSTVYAELKKKFNGIVYKRRASLTCEKAEAYLSGECGPEKEDQIIRELTYARDLYHIKPSLYLAYDRMAYFGRVDSDLRLTIDSNIRYREDHLTLEYGDEGTLLPMNGDHLLEIKILGGMPIWLVQILNDLEIYPSSFSKYGAIYKHLYQKEAYAPVLDTVNENSGLSALQGIGGHYISAS